MDITKGLDVMRGEFFTDKELYKLTLDGGVTRHHIGEDSMYDYILYIYKDGGTIKYLVKLVPLAWETSHKYIHDSRHFFTGMANDVVEARMRHLLELDQMEFDNTIPEDDVENYYFEIFRAEFRSRKDYIWHFNSEKNIWGEFEGGKVSEMTDDMIRKYVERWIDSKNPDISEQSWYTNYYKRFYKEKYLPFMKNIYAYMRDRSHDTSMLKTHVCKWFIETYLRDEPLFDFYDKPLDSFINNI